MILAGTGSPYGGWFETTRPDWPLSHPFTYRKESVFLTMRLGRDSHGFGIDPKKLLNGEIAIDLFAPARGVCVGRQLNTSRVPKVFWDYE